MFLLGLTGSIGMGKSTTAQMFQHHGCDVWDADAAVHRLYDRGGGAVDQIRQAFPSAVRDDRVDRSALRQLIAEDAPILTAIEQIVHPLVGQDRAAFIQTSDADIVVLDIPLLFETGGDSRVDATVCVLTSAENQRERVLNRGSMSDADFERIVAKQMPAEEKAGRADFIVRTDTMEEAEIQVGQIVQEIRERIANA